MSLVLGIDTGGTYTDGVIVDRSQKKIIAKAKSLTTRDDLSIGITKCINNMDFDDFSSVDVVSLSTTLATNAIVEGRGCEVGLIMIGMEPQKELPVTEIAIVKGGHDVKGRERQPLDEEEVRAAIEGFRGKVDAIAISGYLCVRNPEHEMRVQQMVREILDLPVVCAHHLGEQQAQERPIETLLSGPASSIIGATFLANEKDAMVLDMGGTTTDIATLKNGIPRIDDEGARVGGWLTRVEAAAINTYGLGGDSYLQLTNEGTFKVGPQRVWPICVICHQHPHLLQELKSIHLDQSYPLLYSQITDCFMILNEKETVNLSEREMQILDVLRDGPHSLFYISARIGSELNFLNLERLVNTGVLGRISVTPTDILHATGQYDQWCVEASQVAVTLLAQRFRLNFDEFISIAKNSIVNELCYTILQTISIQDGNDFILKEEKIARYFIEKQLEGSCESNLGLKLEPKVPIIGIGAPVRAWLPPMAEKLNARLVIPENPEVANAFGSATGRIMDSVKIHINPGECSVGYVLHSSWEMKNFEELDEAVAYAIDYAKVKATEMAKADGAKYVELVVHHKDNYAKASMIENDIYVGSEVEVIATERPEWERTEEDEHFFVDTIDRGMTLNH